MFPKSSKIQEYQNHYPKFIKNQSKSPKIINNLSKSMKNTKNLKKTQSQRENDLRPKLVPTTLAVLGILSSCPRVMTMQCWKSQIPPPLSTRLRAVRSLVFCFCVDQKEKKHDSAKFPSKIKTQRQVKS